MVLQQQFSVTAATNFRYSSLHSLIVFLQLELPSRSWREKLCPW